MSKIKVMIVDDQPILREGLKSLLSAHPDIEVVKEATHGKEAVELVGVFLPEVILMDIRMPVMDGVEATRLIKLSHPNIIIIILTTFDDDQYILDALRYGASGYLLKDIGMDQLAAAIKDGAAGNLLLPGRVAIKLSKMIQTTTQSNVSLQQFTHREQDIIRLLVQGRTNTEISEELFLTIGTVKNYLSQIYSKAEVVDRSNAIIYFKKHGF